MIENENLYFLQGGKEMGQLFREKNWELTSMGPATGWPQSLRTTLDIMLHSLFPMFLFWGDEHICFYNDAYRPSLGNQGKHPSILGQRAEEAWPEIWSDIQPMIDKVMTSSEAVWHEDRLLPIFRNGQMENVYWTFCNSSVRNGAGIPMGVLVVCRETTEQVKTQEQLADSEQRFRELADQSPMWIWMTDVQINIKYANPELLEFIGIKKVSDFTGQVWKDNVHPEDIEIVNKGFGNAVEKSTDFSIDFRIRKASTGIYEWFTIKGVPRFERKTLTGFIGTGMNIHRQKTFSEQLRKEVQMRTKELVDINEELEIANKELQAFTYISSHDLQEPLRKIQTFSSLLLDNEFKRLSEKGKDQFERMASAAKRMQVLINDLLAYSRLEMEDRKFETMDLSQIFEKVKADLSDEIEQKDAIVELVNSCKIDIVHFQFRQLLYNLISNSLKYSREGRSPVIRIESDIVDPSQLPQKVTLPATEYVKVRITDNGIGFDNAYSEKIFEVFQRLHGREKYKGTGVGLAIAKKIVENHKGFIKAKGTPDNGASFEIFIPQNHSLA